MRGRDRGRAARNADRTPQSAPGEKIIFGATFNHDRPADFQVSYTGAGGDFGAAGSGTKAITNGGLNHRNVYFFIDQAWDKKSAVTVKLELQKVADGSVVRTENWTFSAKTTIPTTVAQVDTEDERPLPSSYQYTVGPPIAKDGSDSYLHQTVLEEFTTRTSNLTVADLKPEYAKANGLTTPQQITDHFFGTSRNNGTFTVSAGDHYRDKHTGQSTFEPALTAMKEIWVDLPQVYSAEPGKPLGTYTVRRILKVDGSKVLKKWKT